MKQYLGDSVYVDFDGFMVKLTTENSPDRASNTIYLEPAVWAALQQYVAAPKRGEAMNDPDLPEAT